MSYVIEPHFLAVMSANQAALTLAMQLPQNDIVLDLQEILRTQLDLTLHLLNGTQYGRRKLKKFMEDNEKLMDSICTDECF